MIEKIFPLPNAERHVTLNTGLMYDVDVHVKTWNCSICGRGIGQDYAEKSWKYLGRIVCPDCNHRDECTECNESE